MKSISNIFKKKLTLLRKESSWKKLRSKTDFSTRSQKERQNYILKIDIELLESKIKQIFQDLGELTYKESLRDLKKKTLKRHSKKYKLVNHINQLKKEIKIKELQAKTKDQ